MTPFVFIVLVAVVLVLMIYWVINARSNGRFEGEIEDNPFKYEAAQELFSFIEPDAYLAENTVRLMRSSFDKATFFWHFSKEKWQEFFASGESNFDKKEPVIRIYEACCLLRTFDLSVHQRSGSYEFKLAPATACYVSLGIKEREDFKEIMSSNTIMRHI